MKVQYGPITFSVLQTKEFLWEALYSDDGVDYLCTHVRISVVAQLNPKATSYTFEDVLLQEEGAMPATTFQAIRHTLMQPRQVLLITDELTDEAILEIPFLDEFADDEDEVDIRFGPRPISCRPVISGACRTWAFEWTCECWVRECPFGDANENGLLSNRWQESSHVNQWHMESRVCHGKAVFRRDFLEKNNVGQIADYFRSAILPPVPDGFRREAIDVIAQSDGLALLWTVRDTEYFYDLGETDPRQGGSGVLRIDGVYGTQSISSQDGVPMAGMSLATITLRCYGNKYSNQWTMLQTLLRLVVTKMKIGPGGGTGVTRHCAIKQSMGVDAKWSEIEVAYQQNGPKNGQIFALNMNGARLDVQDIFQNQDGLQPNFPNDGSSRGSSYRRLVTQALTVACAGDAGTPPVDEEDASVGDGTTMPPYGSSPAISVQSADILPEFPTSYSDDIENSSLTRYQVTATIRRDTGLRQLASTGPATSSSPPIGSGGSGSMGGSGGSGSGPGPSNDWGGGTGSVDGPNGDDGPVTWPSKFYRMHGVTEQLVWKFEAESLNEPPLLPSPQNADGNLVLLRPYLDVVAPVVANDGVTVVYTVSGEFLYGLKVPFQPGASMNIFGALPWTSFKFPDLVLTPDDFSHGIIDDGDESSGSGSGRNP